MTEITVTVSGPVGCGKSAIAGEIEIALKAIGVPVVFADEKEMRSEKNMTGADWTGYLEMYKPSVVISEQIAPPAPHLVGDRFVIRKSLFGQYISTEMPPGCDMIVVFANVHQHVPVWIGMPHQLYVRTARELLSKHGGDHLTIVPYRNAHKFDVEASALAATEEQGDA